jgi:hypothetical protein
MGLAWEMVLTVPLGSFGSDLMSTKVRDRIADLLLLI